MGDEGGFPLVTFLNSDIVISPLLYPHCMSNLVKTLASFNEVGNQGEGVCISDSVAVEVLVILARSEAAVLLLDEEERGSLGGFGRTDFPREKVFVDELIRGLSFFD